jgi:hypothetical protein
VDALEQTLMHPRLRNPVVKLRTPDGAKREAIVTAELRKVLNGQAEPAAALTAAAQQWAEMNRAKGSAALSDYRISVGLLGK